jgi:hypothetical protein
MDKASVKSISRGMWLEFMQMVSSICGLTYKLRAGNLVLPATDAKTIGTSWCQDDSWMNCKRVVWAMYHAIKVTYPNCCQSSLSGDAQETIMHKLGVRYAPSMERKYRETPVVAKQVARDINESRMNNINKRAKDSHRTKITVKTVEETSAGPGGRVIYKKRVSTWEYNVGRARKLEQGQKFEWNKAENFEWRKVWWLL